MIDKRDILLIGLNHKTAPVEIRECIGFAGDQTDQALLALQALRAAGCGRVIAVDVDRDRLALAAKLGADETFFQIVRHLARPMEKTARVTANILGATGLGFRHRDDIEEVTALLSDMGISVNVTAPMGSAPADIARLSAAHFNVLMYPETGESACRWMERELGLPYTKTVPIGVGATVDFLREVGGLIGVDPAEALQAAVGSLKPKYQAVIALRYFESRSVAEIAELLTISEHTVAAHVKHIYRKLAVHSRSAGHQIAPGFWPAARPAGASYLYLPLDVGEGVRKTATNGNSLKKFLTLKSR